jgi:hypothetical protein
MTQASPTNAKQAPCAATRRDGALCRAPALPDRPFCFAHDPDRQEAQRAARERGGKGRATAARADKLVPATLRPVLDGLVNVFDQVKAGKMDPKVGTALGSIASAIVRVYQVGTLEERLAALEQAQQGQNGGRGT